MSTGSKAENPDGNSSVLSFLQDPGYPPGFVFPLSETESRVFKASLTFTVHPKGGPILCYLSFTS